MNMYNDELDREIDKKYSHSRSCSCSCCFLQIKHPRQLQKLDHLEVVKGITDPCKTVYISIDCKPPLKTVADRCGMFCVENPYSLSTGAHTVCVHSCPNCCTCHTFYIEKMVPVPPPVIDVPECGSVTSDSWLVVSGCGIPGGSVRICIKQYGCKTAVVDQEGKFKLNFGVQLIDGQYTIEATQILPDGRESETIYCEFTVKSSKFVVKPLEARMGLSFRTVDIDVIMYGIDGIATVYYLLLPPGSPAPTVKEVMNYKNKSALLDGTAATGEFETIITKMQATYIWELTGLDKPEASPGVTGVIDGYRYDIYIYVVSGACNSGVLTFENDAMGMPYAGGRGTPENPFTICELTQTELQMYPDLLADNILNVPGVNENARMLENIERLITLYEATNGFYGLSNSMELNYLMTSDINLSGYAAAYDGEGWQSIGDIDGWINGNKMSEHLFSGLFSGGGYTIRNLSITPKATENNFVGYRGLFAGVDKGTIEDLILSDVTINAFTTSPGFAQLGSFISIARTPTLTGLTLYNANITADTGKIAGDTHTINVGGFVGEIYDGGITNNITGKSIIISVPERCALALGGFVGFTDKFESYERYEDIQLSYLTISGHAMIGGFAGYMPYGVNFISNVSVNQITIVAPGGESGGLIGRLYIFEDTGECLIEDCTVENVYVFSSGSGTPGGEVGGLIGTLRENPFTTEIVNMITNRIFKDKKIQNKTGIIAWPLTKVHRCYVNNGQISCAYDGGGLIGHIEVKSPGFEFCTVVTMCKAKIFVIGLNQHIGGLIGYCNNAFLNQSFSLGEVYSFDDYAAGICGEANYSRIKDCYTVGNVIGEAVSGGCIGIIDRTEISNCYSVGNIAARDNGGGIVGLSTVSSIKQNLVLGGAIVAANCHRILGFDNMENSLESNYSLNTVNPVPEVPDPDGLDGGTITSGQIVSTMQTLGWDSTTVWNTETVSKLGRPTLLQNPE